MDMFFSSVSNMEDICIRTEPPTILDKNAFKNASFIPLFIKTFLPNNISNQCKKSLHFYFNEVINLKPWALEMLDASGKLPSSFFSGTMIDYGSMEDCIKIKARSNDRISLFKGKFCMAHLRHPLFQTPHHNPYIGKSYVEAFGVPPDWIRYDIENDIPLRFGFYGGICVPSTCTDKDLYNTMNAIAEPLNLDVTVSDCQEEEPREMSVATKLALIFLVILLLLCASGTVFDLNDRKIKDKEKKLINISLFRELLKAFSLYTNVEHLFSVNAKKTPLDCIHGIRVFLCLFVVWAHATIYPTLWKELRYKNFHFLLEALDKFMVIDNIAPTFVDCFFALSAFLLVSGSGKKHEQSEQHTKRRKNVLDLILQKYCRLTPPIIFIILLSFLLPILYSGPVWNTTWEHHNENCLSRGWANLLYIQNYKGGTLTMCMLQTWYMAASVQILVISLVLMVVIKRHLKLGVFLNLIMFFASTIYYYYRNFGFHYPFAAYVKMKYPHLIADMTSNIYIYPSYHIAPHLIGMLFGWIYLEYGNQKLPKKWLVTGWSLSLLCILYVNTAMYLPTEDLRIMSFYNSTRNSAISFGVSWILFACGSGHGGAVDKVLSLKVFVPLSRISYCIYLVHPLYVIFRDASFAERSYMDKISQGGEMPFYYLCSILGGFFVHILVEEPFSKIYDLLKKNGSSSRASPNNTA